MSEKMMKKSRVVLFSLLGLVAVAALSIWGCGDTSYDSPAKVITTTKTATALIEPTELNQWLTEGKVNKAGGYDRVVILQVDGTITNYDLGHIAGSQSVGLTTELAQTRVEGPMYTGSMVPDGMTMDTLIQRTGIDANTTIVFTTSEAESGSPWNLTRGYTVFRYWGFPKERLKVLNGGNKAWKTAGLPLVFDKPTIARSSYAVTPNGVNRVKPDLRASLSDMIAAVSAGTVSNDFIDGRSTDVPAGPTSDLIDTSTPTKYVVFEGAVHGGRNKAHTLLHTAGKFKSVDDVKTALAIPAGRTSIYTICRAGNIASVLFFAIDGYAYYNETTAGTMKAVWYDGSWGQWGLMASSDKVGTTLANAGGKLAVGSIWDTTALTDSRTYNIDAGRTIVTYTSRLLSPEPSYANGNQIEDTDAAYHSPVTTSGGSGTSGGGGGC
ncbi:sulfurtransferase [Geomonas oryzisoli]|uniref:Sulfurtransferase n=1 Tax=Geomonas oryzisoli TaxID=2847992 RepID=A0ABX8J9F1_9BACT|nr:selenite/tellurite reduction operon rhodanese-like protein ExtH [Geomonas oryzisoli]QWV93309.1 sulfurtransferase [Geomonas oryzisoli]